MKCSYQRELARTRWSYRFLGVQMSVGDVRASQAPLRRVAMVCVVNPPHFAGPRRARGYGIRITLEPAFYQSGKPILSFRGIRP